MFNRRPSWRHLRRRRERPKAVRVRWSCERGAISIALIGAGLMAGCHIVSTNHYGDAVHKRWRPLLWEGSGELVLFPEFSIAESGTHIFRAVELPITAYPDLLKVKVCSHDRGDSSQLADIRLDIRILDCDDNLLRETTLHLDSPISWEVERRQAPARSDRRWVKEFTFPVRLRVVHGVDRRTYKVIVGVAVEHRRLGAVAQLIYTPW